MDRFVIPVAAFIFLSFIMLFIFNTGEMHQRTAEKKKAEILFSAL